MATKTGQKDNVPRIGLVLGGFVVNLIKADLAFAQTLSGYDLVGIAEQAPGGWLINGTVYPDAPPSIATQNTQALNQTADSALDGLRAYVALASPTNAQTLAVVRLLCRTDIALIRLATSKLDATD